MRPRTHWFAMAAWVTIAGVPALAQPVSFLRVEAGPDGRPTLRLDEVEASTGVATTIGDALDHAAWLYGLGEHGSHNYTALPPGLAPGDAGALDPRELLDTSQAVVFGIERTERVVTMTSQDFASLAARAGVEWAALEGVEQVRVRRIEASKAIVRWTPQPEGVTPSTIVTAKRGERAEIRPLFDATTLDVGSIVPVRVYIAGEGASGVTVIATHGATGAEHRAVADAKGIAILALEEAGVWRVEVHHVEFAPRDADDGEGEGADAVVYSATLSFEVIGGAR